MNPLTRFREIFWDAFQKPPLKSEKFKQTFNDLETVNDQMAGPLYAVYENGDCLYVFTDKDKFPHINSPHDLFEKMEGMITYYKKTTEGEKPSDKTEEEDQQMLMFQADMKMELAELCLVINEDKLK